MNDAELDGVLAFLRSAEMLKVERRSAWTSAGQLESVAEHTWRLCLMALLLAPLFEGVDPGRLLAMCVVHDLGEALGGDIPAVDQDPAAPKSAQERRDLLRLVEPLPPALRDAVVELWDAYEAAATPEARAAKALDKLETLIQHNQGANPPDFDYGFNLAYGAAHTRGHPLVERMREILDAETRARRDAAGEG